MLQVRKIAFRARGRSAQSLDIGGPRDPGAGGDGRLFLQIRPAFADPRAAFAQRSNSTLSGFALPLYHFIRYLQHLLLKNIVK